MFSANKAGLGALGPALTVILMTLDTRMSWNLGGEFWGSALAVAFGLLIYFVPNFTKTVPVDNAKSGDAS